jgi:hypothetical protein
VAEMFWGERYGIVRDPFGHRWALCTRRELTLPTRSPNACPTRKPKSPRGRTLDSSQEIRGSTAGSILRNQEALPQSVALKPPGTSTALYGSVPAAYRRKVWWAPWDSSPQRFAH